MVLSERRFAVQLREAYGHTLHHFDDLGCALVWLDEQESTGKGGIEELWVHDPHGDGWIDGIHAHYRSGSQTPMGYGFDTASAQDTEQLSLQDVRQRIRVRELERHAH